MTVYQNWQHSVVHTAWSQPFRIKDLSTATFWFGRYTFWNLHFRQWINGYI